MKKIFIILAALMTFVSANAFALTYTIQDNWINWPGYSAPYNYDTLDEIGVPHIDSMTVVTDQSNNYLQSISVNYRDDSRISFDSLFINTSYNTSAWDAWDYYAIDRGSAPLQQSAVGDLAASGLYTVMSDYNYTYAGAGRTGNPNGIDADSLAVLSSSFLPSYDSGTFTLKYDFSNMLINVTGGLFVAYAPYCANDVIGGTPVPEPGTLLLLGGGLVGLAYLRKRKKA